MYIKLFFVWIGFIFVLKRNPLNASQHPLKIEIVFINKRQNDFEAFKTSTFWYIEGKNKNPHTKNTY